MTQEFITLRTGNRQPDDLLKEVGSYVENRLSVFSAARTEKEETWLECWATYLSSPASDAYLRKTAMLKTVGDVTTEWRHRINTGNAFAAVETINSYLQSAFFPNKDWLDFVPTMPGMADTANVVKRLAYKKLRQGDFQPAWDGFIRQMLITGWSVLALPWRYEARPFKKMVKVSIPTDSPIDLDTPTKYEEQEIEKVVYNAPAFEVLDVFDCYADPTARDPNEGDFIRKYKLTRAAIIQGLDNGHFSNARPIDVVQHRVYGLGVYGDQLKTFQGLQVHPYSMGDSIELVEFWGDIHLEGISYYDVCVTLMGDKVIRMETNPFWCGKPFVIGTYIPVVRSAYGLGALEPTLGLIHELNVITNQRLDNLELYGNLMWTLLADAGLTVEDVYAAPGKVFPVTSHDALRPVQMPAPTFVNYQETALLEQRVDKNTGTGAFIGVGVGRSGERVTAEEVQATVNAGGARLSGLHKHIEDTSLLKCLRKLYRLLQQNVRDDEVVSYPGVVPGSRVYAKVGLEELENDFDIEVMGASWVADRKNQIDKLTNFMKVLADNPALAQQVEWKNPVMKLARLLDIDDAETFFKTPEPTADPTQPQNPLQAMGIETAITNNLNADGGQNLAQQMYGLDIGQQTQIGVPPI